MLWSTLQGGARSAVSWKGELVENHHHKVYVGIDVHRQKHRVAVMPTALLLRSESSRKEAKFLDIKNNSTDFERLDAAIREHITSPDEAVIAVDHTGGHYSEPLVYLLQSRGYNVYHLEPKAVKASRERLLDEEGKSDTIDAAGTAYLLYLRDVHGLSFRISAITPELGSKASVLRSLVLQRQQYNKLATQFTNRLHQLLLAVFPEGEAEYFRKLLKIIPTYPTPQDILASQNLKGIKNLSRADKEIITVLAAQSVGVPGELYRELIRDLSQQRNEAIAKRQVISDLIKKEVGAHPYGSILLSFPCLGAISAATIIGVVRNIDRWPSKKKLKKALGVYSTLKQSGNSTVRGRQGKEGSRHGRRALFHAVFGCIRSSTADNDFKDYYLRQVARGKSRLKAVVSTMGKLAEVIYHCLTTSEFYEYQGKYRLPSKAELD
jgi:transposase